MRTFACNCDVMAMAMAVVGCNKKKDADTASVTDQRTGAGAWDRSARRNADSQERKIEITNRWKLCYASNDDIFVTGSRIDVKREVD